MLRPAAARAAALRRVSVPPLAPSLPSLPPPSTSRTQSRALFSSRAARRKPRASLKSTLLRWAAAGGVIYYYATSSVFADEPRFVEHPPPALTAADERPPSLLDEVRKAKHRSPDDAPAQNAVAARQQDAAPTQQHDHDGNEAVETGLQPEGGLEGLEGEAGQEGAFNPETGEINWDCPCLGGMAHGPCGEQFKAAFSCFVYSTVQPKGMDCVDKFKDMQTCFQAHPEIYGSELDDDDGDDDDDDSDHGDDGRLEEEQQPETPAPLEPDKAGEPRPPATPSHPPVETPPHPPVETPIDPR